MLGIWILFITGVLMLLKLPVELILLSILFVVVAFSFGVDILTYLKNKK